MSSSRKENNEEFVAIRDEFMSLMKDVNRDAEMGVAYRDAVDELDHAYSELDRLFNKLQKEKSIRAKFEQELEELKAAQNSNVDLVAQEIERKNREVSEAKADRDRMKEWLDRGVSECKKISDEVIQLRKDLDVSEDNCSALARDKVQLTSHIKRLHEDLEHAKAMEAQLQNERSELITQFDQKKANLDTVARRHKETEERETTLRAEVGELTGRVNRLAECEQCLVDLVRELGIASSKIRDLDEGISSGRVVDGTSTGNGPAILALRDNLLNGSSHRTDSALNITPNPYAPLRGTSSVASSSVAPTTAGGAAGGGGVDQQRGANGGPSVADTRALLHGLANNVEHLNDTVFRFIRGKQRTFEEVQRIQQNEIAALQRDKMALLASHETEKDELRVRCRQLEEQIVNTSLSTDAYTDRAFERLHAATAATKPNTAIAAADAAFSMGAIAAAAGLAETPTLDYSEEMMPTPRPVTDNERDAIFTQLQAAFREYQELSQTIQHLRDENARIRHKASRRKIDWVKVNDSRTRYQHLLKEIEMMKDYQKRLVAENNHLEQLAQMHMEKASQTPEEAAAKRYRHSKEQQLSRIAFDEWKAKQSQMASPSPAAGRR